MGPSFSDRGKLYALQLDTDSTFPFEPEDELAKKEKKSEDKKDNQKDDDKKSKKKDDTASTHKNNDEHAVENGEKPEIGEFIAPSEIANPSKRIRRTKEEVEK